MKTITIKGKEYITVNERLKEFRSKHKECSLESEFIDLTNDRVVMRATIKNESGRIIAQGVAYEDKDNQYSVVNKTSYIENCETSAWGRALANFGIGIDTSVASADEVAAAIVNQNDISPHGKETNETYYEVLKKDLKSCENLDDLTIWWSNDITQKQLNYLKKQNKVLYDDIIAIKEISKNNFMV